MRLTIFSRARGPIVELLADEIELAPGRPALDIDIAAKAQRIDRHADHVLDRRDRGEVDDRDHLAGDVGKAVAAALQDFRRPAQFIGAECGEECFDGGAAVGGAEIATRALGARPAEIVSVWLPDRTRCADSPAARSSSASGNASWQIGGCGGIEAGRRRSRWHRAGRREWSAPGAARPRQRLRGEALYRIAVDRLNFSHTARCCLFSPAVPPPYLFAADRLRGCIERAGCRLKSFDLSVMDLPAQKPVTTQ